MNLNIVDILIVAVLGLSVVSGMYKGFLSSMLAAVGFVGAWFGSMYLYPQLAKVVLSNNSLMDVLKYYLDVGTMFKTPALGATLVSGVTGDAATLNIAIGELSSLPTVVTEAFRNNVIGKVFSTRVEAGASVPWLSTFTDYLNQTIWVSVINVVAFIVLFVVLYVIASLIVNLLNNVFHFPMLSHFDWLLGGLFGALRGYVIMILILAVLPMILTVVNLKEINEMVAASQLMPYFPANFAIPDIIKAAFNSPLAQ